MLTRYKSLVQTFLFLLAILAWIPVTASAQRMYVGFDSNEYPGDAALPNLRHHFDYVGYWLNNPPGSRRNEWVGRRDALQRAGFGFLVLANGKLDKEILNQTKAAHLSANTLGQRDGTAAVAAATHEHFPARTILFLDQEEGGRLLPEQMAYLLGWTEAVAHAGFRPGVYISGQSVPDGPGHTISTAQNLKEQVAAQHLHEVALWVYQDACPPSPGCTLQPPALSASGTPGAIVWQYAQSPRRPAITAACAKTYAPDGNCYAPGMPSPNIDLNVAASPDPSGVR